ncbi:uncharacterized protein EV422DRAFT_525624 [Fimicolochytrium jonesii]|uniref:uncharacterized protein n=1 Tax=Fimicolochytrium jonesii TaxID=1396493 RepID=UPI0022FE39F5|nr:uncharacterized protein EV422DRAFT_525624 [Fimicolochytrium jonesii]KAI8822090.1 hypothetical protein EV422DRAFT_525624 [Fimicolochytrium jonesii]
MIRHLWGSLWRPGRASLQAQAQAVLQTAPGQAAATRFLSLLPARNIQTIARTILEAPVTSQSALRKFFPGLAGKFASPIVTPLGTSNVVVKYAPQSRMYSGWARPSTFNAPPFSRIFSNSARMPGRFAGFNRGQRFGGGGRRNFTSGFAQQAYTAGTQSAPGNAFNLLAGLKVLPGAIADDVQQKKSRDDLTQRIRARASARKQRCQRVQRPAGVSARVNAVKEAAVTVVDVEEVDVIFKKVAQITSTKLALPSLSTVRRDGKPGQLISLSFFLYGPPAWEMDTVHPGLNQTVSPTLISELRTLAKLHHDHLQAVAATLEKLKSYGIDGMNVVEEDAGMYELKVRFPDGFSKINVIDFLLVLGIDPCSPHFRLETITSVGEKDDDVGAVNASAASPSSLGSDYDDLAMSTYSSSFPWPKAHSPSSSYHAAVNTLPASVPQSPTEFLHFVDDLMGSRGRLFQMDD